jgi:hypothetical protein
MSAGSSSSKSVGDIGAYGEAGSENDCGVNRNSCDGTVVITAQNDDSHFLGIPGQKIIVEVIH